MYNPQWLRVLAVWGVWAAEDLVGPAVPSGAASSAQQVFAISRQQIEADWLRQDQKRVMLPEAAPTGVTREEDAAGGVEGPAGRAARALADHAGAQRLMAAPLRPVGPAGLGPALRRVPQSEEHSPPRVEA